MVKDKSNGVLGISNKYSFTIKMTEYDMETSQTNADESANQPHRNEATQLMLLTENDNEVQRLRIKNAKLRLKLQVQQNRHRGAFIACQKRQLDRRRNGAVAVRRPRRDEFASVARKPQNDEFGSPALDALNALVSMTPVVSALSSGGRDAQFTEVQDNMQARNGDIALGEISNEPSGMIENEGAVEYVVQKLGEVQIGGTAQ